MSTKADFYDGRGRHAVWLGSIQGDADRVHAVACGRLLMDATDPVAYADAVADLLDAWTADRHGHGYHPRDRSPWLWPDSQTTSWVIAFDHGRVWITTGRAWRPADTTDRGLETEPGRTR